mmetsp:Transcript_24081/g.47889  ORF Transcript_24081/g.47889 Transcript_24081/m.47889 type:complete len:215 (-) Transcript_24081:725-1369(-)
MEAIRSAVMSSDKPPHMTLPVSMSVYLDFSTPQATMTADKALMDSSLGGMDRAERDKTESWTPTITSARAAALRDTPRNSFLASSSPASAVIFSAIAPMAASFLAAMSVVRSASAPAMASSLSISAFQSLSSAAEEASASFEAHARAKAFSEEENSRPWPTVSKPMMYSEVTLTGANLGGASVTSGSGGGAASGSTSSAATGSGGGGASSTPLA